MAYYTSPNDEVVVGDETGFFPIAYHEVKIKKNHQLLVV
jgi:hypothetical protein